MENNVFKWMVFVKCFTFNHAPYIVDAMNGFTMQKTTFPYICCIVDDASTDDEPEVIRKYLQDNFDLDDKSVVRNEETDDYVLCFAQHKTNKNCYFAVLWLKYNHYRKKSKMPYISEWQNNSKYIALCEGDDYWIDPMKLQMQVDFLEANPDYGMCYTDFDVLFQRTDKHLHALFRTSPNIYIHNYPDVESFVLRRGYVAPMTWLVRKELWPSLEQRVPSCDGTFVMFAHFLRHSKVKCLEEVTATYRVLEESAAHSKKFEKVYQREKSILNTQYMLIDAYGLSPSLKDECRELHLRRNLAQFVANGKLEDVDECRRMIKNPTNIERILFFLSMTSLGRKIVYYARKNRNN